MTALRSMTAFGRACHSSPEGSFSVEIQSVNRRFLELNFTLPSAFFSFEPPLRKVISSYLGRGGVTVFIKFMRNPSSKAKITPNLSLAKGLKEAWESIATALNVNEPFSLSLLKNEKELLEEMDDDEISVDLLVDLCKQAVVQLVQMKEVEGKVLREDLIGRFAIIAKKCDIISENSHLATEAYRKKLSEKIELLLGNTLEKDERLFKEIALFAEKIDITEEIIRFNSHIQKAREVLTSSLESYQETKGKILEFLVQELLREINTIGSKAADQKIIHLVVEIKAELEKIKEQSQNIE